MSVTLHAGYVINTTCYSEVYVNTDIQQMKIVRSYCHTTCNLNTTAAIVHLLVCCHKLCSLFTAFTVFTVSVIIGG